MKVDWDGHNFTPLSAQNLEAAMMISRARNRRQTDNERAEWQFRCPDCSGTKVFTQGSADCHDC